MGDIEVFSRDTWGRCPVVWSSESRHADGLADVWSLGALDELLTTAARRPTIRLIQDGVPVPPSEYAGRTRLGGRDLDDVVDPAKVATLYAAGATVVAQSLHRTQPSVKAFVERLAEDVSHPLQANSYLTPPDAVGLAPHADRHDVFVIQSSGTKRWTVDGLGEIELTPGDTMYIPAGTRHSAASTESASLHLTIGVLSVTYRSVLERMLRSAPAMLDRPLPLRYRDDDRSLDAELAAMIDDVVDHLRNVDVSAADEAERARVLARPPRSGSLVRTVDAAKLSSDTLIRMDVAGLMVVVGDNGCEVSGDGSSLTAPTSCGRAIEQLATGETVTVGGLVGLDAPSRVILARRLVAAGFCSICE
ncbi:MAG: cupin domain-containing protein [Ilumatobacter sp.]|uniref:cupin domain-containing protein n=1 Tax=Ilumatobacter sp. TaxID=1967498 RepID=UPI003C769326